MAKRSQRRSLRQERDHPGCIWGLINIFDFRNGRSTKRLLTDRRRMSKQSLVAGNSSNQNKKPTADVAKISVKKLMEEEMINEKTSENQPNSVEIGLEQSGSGFRNLPEKYQTKSNRIKSGDVDVSELDSSIDESSDNLDLEHIVEELVEINRVNGDLDILSNQVATAVEEKLVAAVESRCCSKEFIDALQTLRENKGLFLKLLEDPNSKLVNLVQDLKDRDQMPNLSEEKRENVKIDESSGKKQRNFFRRRSKSLESYPVEKELELANKIVVLKPGPTGVNLSQFSFTEIKRKLRNAMGKERQGVSPRSTLKYSSKDQNGNNGEKGSKGENYWWRSPNSNHKYTERYFKKGEKVKDVNVTSRNVFGGSNINVEAKKHLSEMLKNGDENPESMNGQLPKLLGRILSLPEYNGSPWGSPRRFGDDKFITASQMRLSPRSVIRNNMSGVLQENVNDRPSPRWQNSVRQLGVFDDQECSSEIQSFTQDVVVSEVKSLPSIVGEIEEMTESRLPEEEKIISSSLESSNDLIIGDIDKEIDDTEESFPCLKSPFFGEGQTRSSLASSPSRRPVSIKVEDSICAIDKMERPSPVSVLEPFFIDDDISPASTIFRPDEKEIQPRQIQFEEQSSTTDQGICTRISLEDEESPFEYVEAVLLGSGLNWDEFLLRWISMYEILYPSLFDEVELFSSRPRYDQKLLFDCANEALREVCETYFSCFSGAKPNIQTAPKGMDLIQEIWKRVERLLVRCPQPYSLEGRVKTDLARSRKWVNLRSDIELIVFEMGEGIFVDLVDEIVLSFADDTLECGFSVVSDQM